MEKSFIDKQMFNNSTVQQVEITNMYIVHVILTRYFKIWSRPRSSKPSQIIVDFSI